MTGKPSEQGGPAAYARGIDRSVIGVRLLDTPAVIVDGEARPVLRRREQAVLARLALAAPRTVPIDVLVADVWGHEPPATVVDAVRVHVSNLRKLLGGGRPATEVLRTEPGGYRFDLSPDGVDVATLEGAVRDGDVAVLAELVATWPDHDLGRYDPGSGFFEGAARRIEELRLQAVEAVAAAALAAGEAERVVGLVSTAVDRAPYREHLWELLIRVLTATDRRTEALRAGRRARGALAELGMEPGRAILDAEKEVFADAGPPTDGPLVSRYADADGSRIAYATIGDGTLDLLFLHGGFIPFETMREAPRLARFLDELADRFRVLLVDRRGIGMSDGPADGGSVRLDHWVDDCRAVLGAVESQRAIVFGHEHSGPVAIRLAAELPDRVAGLVLHSTAARPLRGDDHPYGPAEDAFERIDRMIDRLPGSADMLRVVAPSAGEDPQLRAWIDRAGRLGAGPTRARELHRMYLHVDVRHLLPEIKAPAVVLHPARYVRNDAGQARYMAEHLPDAELVMLDSADHLFWLADADIVLAAIDRLRDRIDSARGIDMTLQLRALLASLRI